MNKYSRFPKVTSLRNHFNTCQSKHCNSIIYTETHGEDTEGHRENKFISLCDSL
ncbi:MAG: hypothetical protein JG782_1087 [Anaerophaga sp.]|nr:hypothetical protein [Anaerophaga sp.]